MTPIPQRILKVLVACEFSGVVRRAFRDAGHDAWSCDLLPAEDGSQFHIKDDVLRYLNNWDLLIAHPPCTYLANSGVRWMKGDMQRRKAMDDACEFFMLLRQSKIPRICIENPIQHLHARLRIPKYQQLIQPWQFGDNETKAICLWLKNLPPLVKSVTRKTENVQARVWRMPPGPNRQKERSRFFPGIAKAMAEQWGHL